MKLNLLGAATALILGSAGAMAAPSTASFQITSFSQVVSGGTLTWLGGGYQDLFVESREAGGLGGNQIDGLKGDRGTTSLSTQVAHAGAQVSATPAGLLQGTASATPFYVSDTAQPHVGIVNASQLGEFSLSQAGSVTFTVNYTLTANAQAGDPLSTYAYSQLVFEAGNYTDATPATFTDRLHTAEGSSGTRSGSFTYTVNLASADDVGYYNFNANAYGTAIAAAVPEPGEWALMLAGLGLLGGWRLRQQRLTQGVAA